MGLGTSAEDEVAGTRASVMLQPRRGREAGLGEGQRGAGSHLGMSPQPRKGAAVILGLWRHGPGAPEGRGRCWE